MPKIHTDKERLDWLQSLVDPAKQRDNGGIAQTIITLYENSTVRETIDACMEEQEQRNAKAAKGLIVESHRHTYNVTGNPESVDKWLQVMIDKLKESGTTYKLSLINRDGNSLQIKLEVEDK